MMKITDLSHLFKWENLHNWWLTKYFFAPLYIYCDGVKDHTTSGDLVYPTEVITEAEGAVRLRDHDDRAGPRPV